MRSHEFIYTTGTILFDICVFAIAYVELKQKAEAMVTF